MVTCHLWLTIKHLPHPFLLLVYPVMAGLLLREVVDFSPAVSSHDRCLSFTFIQISNFILSRQEKTD